MVAMNRTALLLLSSLCVLSPRVALAEGDVATRIHDWLSNLGKPKAPPPEDLGARNTFTLNPLALKDERLGVEYEHAFGRGFSLYLAPEFAYGRSERSWELALGGTLGARIFVLGKAPSGIYFGPEAGVDYQRERRSGVLRKGFGLGLGGNVGWTLVFFNRLTVAAGLSAQYRAVPDLESTEEDAIQVKLVPTPRLAIGVAF
jgi:hypothetical protein